MGNGKKPLPELRDGEEVRAVYRVARKAVPTSRSGKRFLSLTLADATGEIEARAFEDVAEKCEPLCTQGGYVRASAQVQLYKGRLELKLQSLEPVHESEVNPEEFAPRSRFEPEAMLRSLRELVEQVKNPHVRALLLDFLDDARLGPLLLCAPAAKSVHHAFVAGLLEHTLSVLQLGWRVCDHYPQLDRDLVTAGCVLHDLGKTLELSSGGATEYTEQGRLVGHLLMTCQWIHERARRIEGFPEALEWHLVHLVAAHHGSLEHGSPKLPQTLEAVVVHALDALDSRLQSFGALFAKDRSAGNWTEWQRLYDRPLFKGPSWDGKPLPHDQRRFEGPGLYAAAPLPLPLEEPLVIEQSEPPLPLPAPRVTPIPTQLTQSTQSTQPSAATPPAPTAARPRPLAVWERPEPRLREYAVEAPERHYAQRPATLDLFKKRDPE